MPGRAGALLRFCGSSATAFGRSSLGVSAWRRSKKSSLVEQCGVVRNQRTEYSRLEWLSVEQQKKRNCGGKPENDDRGNESLGRVCFQPKLYRGARVDVVRSTLAVELELGVVNEKEGKQANDDDAESSNFPTPYPKAQSQPRRVFKTRYRNYTACFYISACDCGQVSRHAGVLFHKQRSRNLAIPAFLSPQRRG